MIAAQLFNQAYAHEPDVCNLYAHMSEAVANTPVIMRGSRAVESISNAAAGIYVMTLRHVYNTFLGASFTLVDANSEEDFTFFVSAVNLAAKTVTFKAMAGGTATDIDLDANLYIKLELGMNSMTMS